MTGSAPKVPFLRLISLDALAGQYESFHFLPIDGEVFIGRDPRCHIVLDSVNYASVSRRHAKITPVPNLDAVWQICDLESANGTYVNGQRLWGCRILEEGDHIILSRNGPEFIFGLQPVSAMPEPSVALPPSQTQISRPHPVSGHSSISEHLTLSQLFPIFSADLDLRRKAYLIPGILTVSFVVLMFLAVGNPIFFNMVLASYIAGGAYFFVYQLCGKHKPWWLLASVAALTILLLTSPMLKLFIFIFRTVLPGDVPVQPVGSNFFMLVTQMFFGAGLMEELLKALPVLLMLVLGFKLRSPYRFLIGVWEPLDGILLGTASALGFTLVETLGQYVPELISDIALQAGEDTGQLMGLQLLIPRILGSIAGHMAYSGYLGYFIGLSVLKPSKRWQILGVGYLTASGLHALWNASGMISFLVLAFVGVLSYAFLVAAILKARALSPTRSQNFATRFSKIP